MNCNVFEQLLIEKIENFKLAFLNTSEQVFYNTEGSKSIQANMVGIEKMYAKNFSDL